MMDVRYRKTMPLAAGKKNSFEAKMYIFIHNGRTVFVCIVIFLHHFSAYVCYFNGTPVMKNSLRMLETTRAVTFH